MFDSTIQANLVIASFFLVLFAPGFSLTLLLFPGSEIDWLERFTLAVITSVALASLIGAALLVTFDALILSWFSFILIGFTLLFMCGAWWRSRDRDDGVTLAIYPKRNTWFTALVLCIALMLITLGGQTLSDLRSPLQFTEFFIEPGQSSRAFEAEVDVEGKLIIPVVVKAGLDHPGPFQIEVYAEQEKLWESAVPDMQPNESWNQTLRIQPPSNTRANALHLYLTSEVDKEPIRQLTVWFSDKDS